MEKSKHLSLLQQEEIAYSALKDTISLNGSLQCLHVRLVKDQKSLNEKFYHLSKAKEGANKMSNVTSAAYAQASCRNMMETMQLESRFPREIRDMVYDALLEDDEIMEHLIRYLDMGLLFDSPVEDGYYTSVGENEDFPHYLDPGYVGHQVATEIAEKVFRKMFSTRIARCRLGVHITHVLEADPFKLGVTPSRYLQKVEIDWDPSKIIRNPEDPPYLGRFGGTTESEEEKKKNMKDPEHSKKYHLEHFEADNAAMQLFSRRNGLSLRIELHRDRRIDKLDDKVRGVLDKFGTTYDHFTRNRIPFQLVTYRESYRELDLKPYYTMASKDEAWAYLSEEWANRPDPVTPVNDGQHDGLWSDSDPDA